MNTIKQFEPILGKWYVESFIGAGSFGRVYKIYREELGKRYYSALKYYSIPSDAAEIKQLKMDGMDDESISTYYTELAKSITSEAAIMEKLKGYTNIVSYEDSLVQPKASGTGYDVFIRMELLTSLSSVMESGSLSTTDAVKLGMDICNALTICRKHDVLHRDIKPDNIFINGNGDYKLGDFGIARTLDKTATFMSKKGTYNYMAPEVYKGERYGAASDIYSLGIVLYRLLNANRLPFLPPAPNMILPNDKEAALTSRMVGKAMPLPCNAQNILGQVILQACAYEPENRYNNAEALKAALTDAGIRLGILTKPQLSEQGNEDAAVVSLWDDATANGVQSPAGNSYAPAGGGQATTDGNVYAPVGSRQAPAGSRQAPTGNVYAPAGGGQAPTGNGYAPAGSRQAPIGNGYAHAGSRQAPTGNVYAPAGGGQTPAGNGYAPTGGRQAPIGNVYAPAGGGQNNPPKPQPRKKRKGLLIGIAAACVALLIGVLAVSGVFGNTKPDKSASSIPSITTAPTKRATPHPTVAATINVTVKPTVYSTPTPTPTQAPVEFGQWSDWSTTAYSESDTREVESITQYRYRDKETTTSAESNLSGWTQYDSKSKWSDYGAWSDWSTNAVTEDNSRQVQTKTQYSYRDISYTSDYSAWNDWSGWQYDSVSEDSLTDVETRTVYGYYYFQCPNCGVHMHGWNMTCPTWAGGCGRGYIAENSWHSKYDPTPWSNCSEWHGTGKYYCYINGELWFKWPTGGTKTQYRYRTRTIVQTPHYSSWSAWSDIGYTPTSTREVRTRTVYRHRNRVMTTTYYYYRYTEWSEWSAAAVQSGNNREVEKRTVYRYRDRK